MKIDDNSVLEMERISFENNADSIGKMISLYEKKQKFKVIE